MSLFFSTSAELKECVVLITESFVLGPLFRLLKSYAPQQKGGLLAVVCLVPGAQGLAIETWAQFIQLPLQPGAVEDRGIDGVVDLEAVLLLYHQPGEPELQLLMAFVSLHCPMLQDLLHLTQQPPLAPLVALQQPVADRPEVGRHILRFPVLDDLSAADLLDQGLSRGAISPAAAGGLRHQLQEFLSQKWLAAAPVQHSLQHRLGFPHAATQSSQQRPSFLQQEACHLHGMTDIEGGALLTANQVVGGGHAKETEREPLVGLLFTALLVERANQTEEAIRVEGEAEQIIHLLHEDHDLLGDFGQ